MSSSETISKGRRERGFVLATTLLVTTLLTVMLAASFLLVSAEQRTTDNSLGTARALALAQAGLQVYFDSSRGLDTSSTYDSVRIALTGGYADVVGKRVRPAGAATGSPLALWVVRSSAVASSAVMAGQVQGTRTIAQFAQFNPGKLPARAAMVALNQVAIAGNGANPLSGHDLGSQAPCVSPGGAAADTHAVSVPSGGYSASNGAAPQGGIEQAFPVAGNLYDSTHIDWSGLLGGNFIPDYTYPPGPWPPNGSSTYLVGYVNGNVTLPVGQKRGMLVVTGNVTVVSGVHWDGIIIAGGKLNLSPASLTSFNIHGMVVTGLNTALGQSVPSNALKRGNGANGSTQIQWTWCYAQNAVASLSSLVPIKNAWADTWSTY